MFGLSLGHLILLGIIVLIFVGPEQLPEVARTIARVLNELRRATSDFQNQFTSSVDLRKWEEHLRQQGPPPQAQPQNAPAAPQVSAAAETQAVAPEAGTGPVEHVIPQGLKVVESMEPAAEASTHGYPSAPAGEADLPVGARPVSTEEKKS